MRPWTIALASAATLSLNAAPARASEASTIIERCTHGQSLGGFSENGYRQALKQMQTGGLEYSDCPYLISKAELAAASGGAGEPGGAGGAASNVPLSLTPAEQREVRRAHHRGGTPVLIGATPVRPGVVSADIASAASTLPTSLVTVLALLLAAAVLLAIEESYKRVRARRRR